MSCFQNICRFLHKPIKKGQLFKKLRDIVLGSKHVGDFHEEGLNSEDGASHDRVRDNESGRDVTSDENDQSYLNKIKINKSWA